MPTCLMKIHLHWISKNTNIKQVLEQLKFFWIEHVEHMSFEGVCVCVSKTSTDTITIMFSKKQKKKQLSQTHTHLHEMIC